MSRFSFSLGGALGALVWALSAATPGGTGLARANETPFVYSAVGAGAGNTVVSIGAVAVGNFVYGDPPLIPFPFLDFHLLHGASPRVDLGLDIATIGVVNLVDLGTRVRIAGGLDAPAALALRLALNPNLIVLGDDFGSSFAAVPGVGLSLGGRGAQLSLIVDFPLYFAAFLSAGAGSGAYTGLTPALRPRLALEIALGAGVALGLRGEVIVPLERPADAGLLLFGFGLSF